MKNVITNQSKIITIIYGLTIAVFVSGCQSAMIVNNNPIPIPPPCVEPVSYFEDAIDQRDCLHKLIKRHNELSQCDNIEDCNIGGDEGE